MKTECTIDRRTRFGRDIVKKTKEMHTKAVTDLHHGLEQLRINDLNLLFNICNN